MSGPSFQAQEAPLVSIVIPMYNEGKSVRHCVETVCSQLRGTGRSFEVICVDDGSTDNTLAELESLGKVKKMNRTFAAFALIGMCRWTFNWFDPDRQESAGELCNTYNEIFFRGILKDDNR